MKKCIPGSVIFILSIFFTSIAFAHYEHFTIPKAEITIDGNMEDWNNIEPVYVDDVNDQYSDANYDGLDLHKVYLAKNETFLYIMMTLYDGAPREEDTMESTYGVYFGISPTSFDIYVSAYYWYGKWYSYSSTPWNSNGNNYPSRFVGTGSNFIEWKVYLTDLGGTLNGQFVTTYTGVWFYTTNTGYTSDWDNTYIHIVDEDAASTPTPVTTPSPLPTPTPSPARTPTPENTSGIFGFVYNLDSDALSGVTVTIIGNDFSDSAETDDDGYYEFHNLSEGDYTLTFEKEGYETQTKDISLEEDEELEVEAVTLEEVERGRIYGYVVNIVGDPIENVRLKLRGFKTKTTKTDASDRDGFFEFADLDADTYIITTQKKGYRKGQKSVKLGEGDKIEVEIELRKTSKRGVRLIKKE